MYKLIILKSYNVSKCFFSQFVIQLKNCQWKILLTWLNKYFAPLFINFCSYFQMIYICYFYRWKKKQFKCFGLISSKPVKVYTSLCTFHASPLCHWWHILKWYILMSCLIIFDFNLKCPFKQTLVMDLVDVFWKSWHYHHWIVCVLIWGHKSGLILWVNCINSSLSMKTGVKRRRVTKCRLKSYELESHEMGLKLNKTKLLFFYSTIWKMYIVIIIVKVVIDSIL